MPRPRAIPPILPDGAPTPPIGPPGPPTTRFSFQPSAVNFGNVSANVSQGIPVLVTFNGSGSGTISSITLIGTGFTLESLPTLPITLTAGQETGFQVFIDQPLGTYTSTVQVLTNVGTFTIPVSATTVAGQISVVPAQIAFPNTIVNQTSQPLNVTVTNNSNVSVTFSNAALSSPQFTILPPSPTFPTTLAPGASMTLSFAATPQETGPVLGTFTATTDYSPFPQLVIHMSVVGVLFLEQNALRGTGYIFLMGFGPVSETRRVNIQSVDSELNQKLIFNGTLWDSAASEKVIRRLQFYYENLGVSTLTATAHVQRYDRQGKVFQDLVTSTVDIGTEEADGLEYSAFFDFQIAGEIVTVEITREAGVGPCSLYLFVFNIEDKGEKVENV